MTDQTDFTRRRLLAGLGTGALVATGVAATAASPAGAATPLAAGPGGQAGGGVIPGPSASHAAVPTTQGVTYLGYNYIDLMSWTAVAGVDTGSGGGGYNTSALYARLPLPHKANLAELAIWGQTSAQVTLYSATFGFYNWTIVDSVTVGAGGGIQFAKKALNLAVDTTQQMYFLSVNTTSSAAVNSVRVGYVPFVEPITAPNMFVPITPVRVYDSRDGGPHPLSSGSTRTVSVADATASFGGAKDVVPAGSIAVAYNLTITNTTGGGYLGVYPLGGAFSASAINWTGGGQTASNAAIVKLGGDRQIVVDAGGVGGTEFVVDITGYFKTSVVAF
jgi:hypothetical protein